MKISVLIIAHNEEKYIKKCLDSITNQTQKADEIILVAHNSTDKTISIAKQYPVRIVEFNDGNNPVDARLEGLKHVNGEVVLFTDGDSYVSKNWIEVLSKLLNNNILVGSFIKFEGTLFGKVSNLYNRFFCVSKNKKATEWIWGSSFAFWGKDKEKVSKIFNQSLLLSNKLQLPRVPEDYILAVYMNQEGSIEVTNKTFVTAHEKEKNSLRSFLRNLSNHKNGRIIRRYLKQK